MDSYALVTGLSGFKYRAAEKTIGFSPKMFRNDFRCFFPSPPGWGLYSQTFHDDKAEHNLEVRYGSVDVDRFELPAAMPSALVWMSGSTLTKSPSKPARQKTRSRS